MNNGELTPSIERNKQDIQTLTKTLSGLSDDVRTLVDNHKELGKLTRSQVHYNTELQSLKLNYRDLKLALNKIQLRISALETHRLTTTAESKARFSMVDKIAKYGPILTAILLVLISLGKHPLK